MTETPELEIIVLKLVNGQEIVATMDKNMSYGDRNYIVINPLQIERERMYDDDNVIEFLTFSRWIVGTEQKAISISIQNVAAIANASDKTINSYNEYLDERKTQAFDKKLEQMEVNVPIYSTQSIH